MQVKDPPCPGLRCRLSCPHGRDGLLLSLPCRYRAGRGVGGLCPELKSIAGSDEQAAKDLHQRKASNDRECDGHCVPDGQ